MDTILNLKNPNRSNLQRAERLEERYLHHEYNMSTANVTGRRKPGFIGRGGLSQDPGVVEVRYTLAKATSFVVTVICSGIVIYLISPGSDVQRILSGVFTAIIVAVAELYFLLRGLTQLEKEHDEKTKYEDMKSGRRKLK